MHSEISRTLKTDVLVVGGSGAGVTAAVKAFREGADVLAACKGKAGRSGNAIMAGGGFGIDGYSAKTIVGEERADEGYTREAYFEHIVKEGFFISEQDIVWQFVDDSPQVVRELLDWGKEIGVIFGFRPPASWNSAGISWGKCVRRGFRNNPGIAVLEDTTVVELLTTEGRIAGAVAIDIYSGEIILIEAKAVVLATGGYQPFSFKNTVTDMTGDGPAMAYRAGAKLADMEFLLAFPTALTPRSARGSIYPFVFEMAMRGISHRALDKNGDEIVIPEEVWKLAHRTKLSKLCSDYYWGHAIAGGRGTENGGVYMDFSQNDPAERAKNVALMMEDNARHYPKGCYKGDNIEDICDKVIKGEPFEVGLGYEYSMGGVLVDAKMASSVPGLFAGGEAASGVFGACRAGDGLTEMLGQGYRAGWSAADYCKTVDGAPILSEQLGGLIAKILRPLENRSGESPFAVQNRIERAADEGFGVIRNENDLLRSLDAVLDVKEILPSMAAVSKNRRYNFEWITALQAENLQICAEAGVRAAVMRKESRGCHIRSDYEAVDHDKWCVRIIAEDSDGAMKLAVKTPNAMTLPLLTGREENVMSYFLSKKTAYKGRG